MQESDLYNFLNRFSTLPKADFEKLTARLKERSVKKGVDLVTPGQIQTELYFVQTGVQMSYFQHHDNIHVIAFTYPPGICAIPDSFQFQKPTSSFLTCITDSQLHYLKYEELQELFNQSHQLERLFRKMTEAVLAGMIERHIELHALTIEERFKRFCNRSPHLLQLVPHKYIASYLSINASNFSKLYNQVRI